MEKPTYTAIDYNSKENKVIEERIRNYYLPVKNTFENIPMMEDLAKLTKEEEAILMLTEEVWNRFLALPINHPMEANEIAMKIHDIQRMIISRPGFRMNQEMFRQYGKGNSDKG